MCGIVGARHDWLLQQGLDPQAALQAAVQNLRWRGPDGERVLPAGPWWLGCARLAISAEASRQPVATRSGRHIGVLNGAVTNARALWAELLPGAERRTTPPNDAWLPVLAVARDRPAMLRQLRGHHAYAVVDTDSGELLLGQDRYAEKPLHCLVARHGDNWRLVAFASTLAALQHVGMPTRPPSRRLAEWFRFGWSRALPHRFSARLRLDSLPRRGEPMLARAAADAWCEPASPPPAPAGTTEAPVDGLRERLVASVARCIDTTVPVALSLSGGVDSSCLALALGTLDPSIPAYQFRAEHASAVEYEAAAAVAKVAGLPLRAVTGGPELLDALPKLTELCGQPLGDPSILAVHAVARTAAADGVRVMLGGEGADELLLGYRRYRALAHLPQLRRLRRFASRWSMRYAARYWRAVVAYNPIRALLAVTPPGFASEVLAPELASRKCWRDADPFAHPELDLAMAARRDDLDGYLPRDLLAKVDVALMAAGIEGRCPYLEAGIESFGRDLTALGKRPLRRAFLAELPDAVQRLPKRGFSVPLDDWFRGDLAWLDVLAEPRSKNRPHLSPGGIMRAVDRHRRGAANLGHGLYLLLACELYLRSIDRD